MDEVTQHVEGVLLLDLFLLEELSDLRDSLSELLRLGHLLPKLLLELLDPADRLLHVLVALLELAFEVLGHFDEVVALLHEVVDLILEAVDLLLRSRGLKLALRAAVIDCLTLTNKLDLLLEHNNLLQLPFNHLLELKDLLVALLAPQNDIQLR